MKNQKQVRVFLFTTLGCHLCEEAQGLWQRWVEENTGLSNGFELVSTEIAEDEQLLGLYGIRIPVLKREDKETELGWPFDLPALQEFMTG